MNETLTVRDFGPIREAEVTFKRVTVFIGPTGGGKSTLAKLAAVWKKGDAFTGEKDKSAARKVLANYGLGNFLGKTLSAQWSTSDGMKLSWPTSNPVRIRNPFKQPESSYKAINEAQLNEVVAEIIRGMKDLESFDESINEESLRISIRKAIESDFLTVKTHDELFGIDSCYVPAERVFYSAIASSFAGLMRDDIGLPKPLLDFVNDLWQARKEVADLDLPMFGVKYEYRNEQDKIRIADREEALLLSETASGIQAVAPLLVLLEHLSRQTERSQSFIIEEPELNLYPEAQQALLNVLIEKCAKAEGKNDLIITTHSPYLLSQLNLLLYAPQVARNHPERAEEIKTIVPEASWIQPGDLAVYYVNGPEGKDGIRSLLDPETGLIAQNALDGTAGKQADAFDRLLDINSGF